MFKTNVSDQCNDIRPLLSNWENIRMFHIVLNSDIFHFFRYSKYGKNNLSDNKKGKRKVEEVPQTQTTVLPRHQEEEETDKSKQAQIDQTYEKH